VPRSRRSQSCGHPWDRSSPGAVERPALWCATVVETRTHRPRLSRTGEGLVVGPGVPRRRRARRPRSPLTSLEVRPEPLEPDLGVRDGELRVHELRVREPDLRHVLRLRDVDPDEEPVPIRSQRRLQFAKALDSDCICRMIDMGSPSVRPRWPSGIRASASTEEKPFYKLHLQ